MSRLVAVASLGIAAVGVGVNSASAASYGPATNGCYGIYWATDWNQACAQGATANGYYKSTANCTAPQIPDMSLEKYRLAGSKNSYDGTDCMYGVQGVTTWYRAG